MLLPILTETQSTRKRQMLPAARRDGDRIIKNPYAADRKNAGETLDRLSGRLFGKNASKADILNGVKKL